MSLNDIQLNGRLTAELYPDVLVEKKMTTTMPVSPEKISFLGQNKRQVLILVDHPGIPHLPDSDLSFLTSVLSACRMSLADVAIVNFQKTDEDHLRDFSAKQVILFGIEPLELDLPMNFPQFQLQPYNGRIYMHAPPLSVIEGDKTIKTQLWNALKTMFNL